MQQGSPNGKTQDTARKVRGRPFSKGNPHRFRPGDPRINLSGRPKSFDAFRELAQSIANEETDQDGKTVSVAEAMLRKCAKSSEAQLIKTFFEYAFGKVPDKLETTLEHKTKLYLNYAHEDSRDRGEDRSRISPTVSSSTN